MTKSASSGRLGLPGASSLMPKTLDGIVEALGKRSRPENRWVADVVGSTVDQAEEAIEEIVNHAGLVAAVAGSIRKTGRTYYAQFPAPIELFAMVRLVHPVNLAESGVSSGVSSAFILIGLASNRRGRLHSIDLPIRRRPNGGNESWALPSGATSGWAVPQPLRDRWDLHLGRSEDLLPPLLKQLGVLDLYCHDSPVGERHFSFEMSAIRPYLRPGSLVVADNTDWRTFEETAASVGAVAIRRRHSSLGAFRVPSRL